MNNSMGGGLLIAYSVGYAFINFIDPMDIIAVRIWGRWENASANSFTVRSCKVWQTLVSLSLIIHLNIYSNGLCIGTNIIPTRFLMLLTPVSSHYIAL